MAERRRREEKPPEPWVPKTGLGKMVESGELSDIDAVMDSGRPILEPEIVDALLPGMESDLLLIGQSKGKFGGGQRRVFKQTQRKTREGNKPSFQTTAVIGNKNGIVGVGFGKSIETVPAREKAVRNAKINVFRIVRGSGSWEGASKTPHSIPFAVSGKCGSVSIELYPAPKGTGLVCEKEVAKILTAAGVQDVWSKTKGQTQVKTNLIKATVAALKQLSQVKVLPQQKEALGYTLGRAKTEA